MVHSGFPETCSGGAPDGDVPWTAIRAAIIELGRTRDSILDLSPSTAAQPHDDAPIAAPSWSGPWTRSTASRVREITRQVDRARRFTAACGGSGVIVIPGSKDPIPGGWLHLLIRVTPRDIHIADMTKLALSLNRSRNAVVQELTSADPASLGTLMRARRVVLVEGKTDVAVFATLVRRWGLTDLTVVAAHSKVRLAALRAVALQLGVQIYVIFDGDGGSIEAPAASAHRIRTTRKRQTVNLMAALPPCEMPEGPEATASHPARAEAGLRQEAWQFGAASRVTPSWCAWQDTVESELAHWPSFRTALVAQGGSLGAKDPVTLAAAAAAAGFTDAPEIVHLLERALRRFHSGGV